MLSVWLPLNGDLHNQGLKNISVSSNNSSVSTNGKIGSCMKITSNTDLGYSHDFNTTGVSFGGWFKFNKSEISSVVSNLTYNSTANSPTGNLIGNNYYGGIGLIWTGNNYYSSNNFSSMTIQSILRTSSTIQSTSGFYVDFDVWVHIFLTWDPDAHALNLYKNGILFNTKTSVEFSDGVTRNILLNYNAIWGGNGPSASIPMYCNDIRIYDHALSPLEVKHLAQGLVLHYPLSMPGQENLYTGSRDFSGTWVNGANWVTDSEQYNGFVVKKKSSIWGGLAQNVPCSNGDIFTISFYAKVDSGGNILSIHRSSLGNVTAGLNILGGNFTSGTDWVTASQTATSWKKYWATVQITSTDITYLQWRIENSVANKFLYVCGMKLERGSRPTPWLPNPADAIYSALGFNDGIEYDVSGYGNNGTRNGTFSWSSDTPRYNTSTYVNSSSSIDHPRCLSNDDQEWTCCAWVKLDNSTSHQGLNNFNKSNEVIHVTTPLLYLNEGANDYYMYGSQIVPVDEWTHIAFVFKNSTGLRNIYINGILKNNYGPNKTSTPYGIPDSVTLFGQNFAGYVSDYREYATALSPEDIRDLYSVAASISDNGTLMVSEVSEL